MDLETSNVRNEQHFDRVNTCQIIEFKSLHTTLDLKISNVFLLHVVPQLNWSSGHKVKLYGL